MFNVNSAFVYVKFLQIIPNAFCKSRCLEKFLSEFKMNTKCTSGQCAVAERAFNLYLKTKIQTVGKPWFVCASASNIVCSLFI